MFHHLIIVTLFCVTIIKASIKLTICRHTLCCWKTKPRVVFEECTSVFYPFIVQISLVYSDEKLSLRFSGLSRFQSSKIRNRMTVWNRNCDSFQMRMCFRTMHLSDCYWDIDTTVQLLNVTFLNIKPPIEESNSI